jgi:hypothetical protein
MVTNAYAGEKQLLILRGAGHNDGVSAGAEDALQRHLDWLWNAAMRR